MAKQQTTQQTTQQTYVALLRGINVGGKNRLPMKPLVALFEAQGCAAVRTYIQSGNVIFEASAALSRRLPALVSAAIARDFDLDVPVVLRSAEQLAVVAANCPFDAANIEPKWLHVAFLRDRPSEAQIAALDPERSPLDRYEVRGDAVYLFYPNGGARSRLDAKYLDRTLSTISTLRNWRTVNKLVELCAICRSG